MYKGRMGRRTWGRGEGGSPRDLPGGGGFFSFSFKVRLLFYMGVLGQQIV